MIIGSGNLNSIRLVMAMPLLDFYPSPMEKNSHGFGFGVMLLVDLVVGTLKIV